ncbi:aconitate hydratase [Sporomusaceae bacterium BoRhaA]|uniref:aconitate hydratase n=1 Tax=Pelorhabdus rhamnosifermentans TaxID=2772457 RepID=UPI001C060A68|nr:aconitate hydratase [Pelorhabdus rhamnosifermentans]MBU2703307.1 aconitate hydratase [Pelorhabdus rhamnosifermentans]
MGKNLFEKIIASHLVSGTMTPGSEVGIRIDQTLTQDALGTMAYLQFEAMGVSTVKTQSVSYVDHNTLQDGFENADDHRYLQTVADKHGILYSKAGNGICHQVHLERFSRPGITLIGSDSHTPTSGAVGMVAMGVGGMDVAVAMAGGAFFFSYPKVIRVNLYGELQPWVSAKDIILEMLRTLTTKGNVGTVVEYAGPGLAQLTVPERSTITNMGAELGVTTSIFPSDELTRTFFKAQGREDDWCELGPDKDAHYDRVIDIDLATLVPSVACPHSPDNVRTIRQIAGLKVDQVLIGSCTNSSYRDVMMVASMLKGKHIHPHVSLGIAPGSKQVLSMIAKNGALSDLVAAGARILESTCGFCVGCGQAPQTHAVSLRTNNRNFEGRSGTKDAQVYLVSPETAVAAALNGVVTDPRDLNLPYPKIVLPPIYDIDDSMIIKPSNDLVVDVYRGPNIGDPPKNTAMPTDLKAKVAIKVGDKITTDHIMPAGPFLKYRSNVPKYSNYVFYHMNPEFPAKCRNNREQGFASIIVAGLSYGQGSSREHAALCPMYLGVRVLLAKSAERIHSANLINFGILQLTFVDEADYDRIDVDDELTIDNIHEAVKQEIVIVRNVTKGLDMKTSCNLTPRQRDIVLSGGLLNYTSKAK